MTRTIPHSTDTARDWLQYLNTTLGFSWERIAYVIGVPVGTLWHIANGGKIPPKWKPRLGVYYNRTLWDMPVAELRWALENREEVT